MKPVTHLFRELVHDFTSEHWNEDALAKLSGAELEALARLLACPSSGVKASVIVRLLAHRHLRLKLSRFTDDPLPWPTPTAANPSAICARKPVSGDPVTSGSSPSVS